MDTIKIICEDNLRCRAINSLGQIIYSDAAKEYGGRQEAFSPTDHLILALCMCIMTVMGIFAKRNGFNINGSWVEASNKIVMKPKYMVSEILMTFYLRKDISIDKRPLLEKAVYNCPVHNSLSPDIKYQVKFEYSV